MAEQTTNPVNIALFLLTRARLAPVIARKLVKRFADRNGAYTEAEVVAWMARHNRAPQELATAIDAELWREASDFGDALQAKATTIMAKVPFEMGAGGDFRFLYWLTRYRKPVVIVETGVSAGWSSQAFLAAIARNGRGVLHSSDFPYFRVRNPEQYIGILVDDQLKGNWRLHTDGDERALPRIAAEVDRIDLLHYDSDKSFSGRQFAWDTLGPKLAPNAIAIWDDIRDNSWFREHVEERSVPFQILRDRFGLIGTV